GATAIGYSGLITPVLWLGILVSAAEVVAFHLLVPWFVVRIVGLILGIWGLVWMIGLLASLSAYPHLLAETTLRVRHGPAHDLPIPLGAITAIRGRERDLPSSMRTVHTRPAGDGTEIQVGVSGRVNVTVDLDRPLTLAGEPDCTRVSFWVDDPRSCVSRVRSVLPAGRCE
ncbi:MAG TPA: hypothetical protein VHC49_10645, partial [Mycobacteriales bacterium]|nr:hypothetical protein [Mycobacteriales bacterium]